MSLDADLDDGSKGGRDGNSTDRGGRQQENRTGRSNLNAVRKGAEKMRLGQGRKGKVVAGKRKIDGSEMKVNV